MVIKDAAHTYPFLSIGDNIDTAFVFCPRYETLLALFILAGSITRDTPEYARGNTSSSVLALAHDTSTLLPHVRPINGERVRNRQRIRPRNGHRGGTYIISTVRRILLIGNIDNTADAYFILIALAENVNWKR